MPLRLLGLLILISIVKGGIQTAVKVAEEGFPPMGLVGWRNLSALCVMALGALAIRRYRRRDIWWPPSGVRPLIVTGIMLTGTFLFFFHGMLYTTASRATVIASAQPLFVLLLARLFIPGERITLAKMAGLTLGLGGILLLVGGALLGGGGDSTMMGDGLILAASGIWAVQSIYEKRILPRYRPFTIVFWQIAISAAVMLLLWAILERNRPIVLDGRTTAAFLYMVFPVTIFVYLTYMYALQYVEVSRISYFNFVMTVSGVLFGVLLLGEPVTPPLVLSVLLVSGGVVLVMRPERVNSADSA